jgi:methylglyoxal synthase
MSDRKEHVITGSRRHIALIAHDNKKVDLLRWAEYNRQVLRSHTLYATGTTGTMLEYELGLPVTCFLSGPVGGDQQIGAKIAEGIIDVLIFFWDPLEPQPHDPDVKALLRLATVWNITVACNTATADMIISSPLLGGAYQPARPDFAPRQIGPLLEAEPEPGAGQRAGTPEAAAKAPHQDAVVR